MIIESMLLKLISFFIFNKLFLGEHGLLLTRGYHYSNIILGFIFTFTIITSIKYCILRYSFESKSKHKSFYSIAIIIVFFIVLNGIYTLVPNYYQVKDWYETQSLADFILLPKYYNILGINILKMTIYESIFSLVLVIFESIRSKTKIGKVGYVLERLLKFCFRYNTIIIFLIYIFTISSKFLTVGIVKNLGIALSALTAIILAIKYYLALSSCNEKNKERYGKENVIITITQTNCEYCLADEYINPLNIFRKYNVKNIGNSILVDGKDYLFISYDAVRYKLIDIKQFKNIAYLIIMPKSPFFVVENTDENGISVFEKKIDHITQNDNFIIYSSKTSSFIYTLPRKLKQKYTFRYKEKLNIKDILDIAKLRENDDRLKKNCKKILEKIQDIEIDHYIKNTYGADLKDKELTNKKQEIKEKINNVNDDFENITGVKKLKESVPEDKNTYIKYALNRIIESFNSIECFYHLLKIGEYITHYIALKSLLDDEQEVSQRVKIDDIRTGMLATWRNCINFDVKYSEQEDEKIWDIASQKDIIKSINRLREVLGVGKIQKNEYTFKKDICQIIADVRNRLMAHGVITYSVSESIVEDLFNVIFMAIKEFENININIKEDEKIKEIFKKEMSLAYKRENKLFLYSYSNYSKKEQKDIYQEYLNYETGKCDINCDTVKLEMNLKYSNKDIEKALGRWLVE